MLKKLFGKTAIIPFKKTVTTRDLIRQEAQIGGTLFGPLPAGVKRQFFALDKHSWVWHEEWVDSISGKTDSMTTRYEVRPNGILKSQGSQPYHYVGLDEAKNLLNAIKLYNKHVHEKMYAHVV